MTWTVRPVPSSNPSDSDPSVSAGAGGTVYFGWADNDAHPLYVLQRDRMIRVSLGGPEDEKSKINKAKLLAQFALRSLQGSAEYL